MEPRTVRVFLPDGTATGMLVADIPFFGGRLLVMPRARIAELSVRPEASKTGVYCLLGNDEENPDIELVFVGETDNVLKRLLQHDKGDKDYWTRAAFIVSTDEYLTKAHARYLESQLIQRARHASRAKIMNETDPPLPFLPESDAAAMQYFLVQLELQMSVLGITFLRRRPDMTKRTETPVESPLNRKDAIATESPLFELRQLPALATAKEIEGEFVILKGSKARAQGVESWTAYRGLREQLTRDGILIPTADPAALEFAADVPFKSPSAAAVVTLARNANGRTEWKVVGGWSHVPAVDRRQE